MSHCEHTCKSGGESHKGALEAMVCDCRPCLALPVGLTASPGLGDSMEHSPWCWATCGVHCSVLQRLEHSVLLEVSLS